MAVFQNSSLYSLSIMINGVRRNIRPGEQISGPDSLAAVVGLTIINPSTKTIIPKENIIQPQTINNIASKNNYRPEIIPKFLISENSKSNFKFIIDEEIKYLENIKNKNEIPSVTLAVLTKNHLDLIKTCCESIFNKVHYKNTTLLIIDTGSTDQSVLEYYKLLNDKCISKNWKYKFVQLDTFHYSKNYNYVIKNHIDTDYVLLQNNDTTAINDYVTEMMQIGIMNKVGSVGCRMFYPNGTIQHDGQTFYNGNNNIINSPSHINLSKTKESADKDVPEKICLVDGNTAAGALMRTKDYLLVDGLDENYKDIFQDVDLMAKIPHFLNKFNYCNKNAEIYHIDNASRKAVGLNRVNIDSDVKYIDRKFKENNLLYAKLPKKVDFSIITLVRNLDDYKDFLNSVRIQNGQHTIELIAIPNFHNTFTSAAKGLNYAKSISSGEILIYCHEDILVGENWLNTIKKHIVELTQTNERIGVLGMAGVSVSQKPIFFLTNENGDTVNNYGANTRIECPYLDELCLITLKNSNLSFNHNIFDGFHFYGANLCLDAKLKNCKNYSINASCYHKSDGSKNLRTTEMYNKYAADANKFNNYAKSKGVFNWRTTTAMSVNGNITLFPKKH